MTRSAVKPLRFAALTVQTESGGLMLRMNRALRIAPLASCFALAAALTAQAGENLIQNGTFEGTATLAAWGSYASANGFSCDNWAFSPGNRAGLATPNGTWIKSGLAVGEYALYIQTQNSSEEVTVQQELGSLDLGKYRISFKYTTRPNKNTSPLVTTYIELVEQGGIVVSVGSVSTSSTDLLSFEKDVAVPAGSYTFRFRQPGVSADRANCFEGVEVRRIEFEVCGAIGILGDVANDIGSPSPAYGVTNGIAAGDSFPVSCGVTPAMNAAGTTQYSCTGWKLYDATNAVVSSGAGASFTYTHPTPAAYRRLEWQWELVKVIKTDYWDLSGYIEASPNVAASDVSASEFASFIFNMKEADPMESKFKSTNPQGLLLIVR